MSIDYRKHKQEQIKSVANPNELANKVQQLKNLEDERRELFLGTIEKKVCPFIGVVFSPTYSFLVIFALRLSQQLVV